MIPQRIPVIALATIASAAIAALILVPALDLAAPGRILHWHVSQASYREGLLEAIVLYAVVLAGFSLSARKVGLAIAGIAIALYLRRHHVDAPALAALVYFEALFAAGASTLALLRADNGVTERLLQFVAGLCMVALVLLASSLAGYGRPDDLLWVAALGSAVVLVATRRQPVSFEAARRVTAMRGSARALALALGIWFVVLLARTNHTTGYDPLWYGFRPEHVLAPDRSLFDETGLVAPVFYFPKLYELVLMPLSAASDFSFPLAYGIYLLAFGAWLAYAFARQLGADTRFALCAAALVATLPAIANMALAPKPDLLAGVLVVAVAALLHRALAERAWAPALYGGAAGALAIQAKLVAIPYVGALVLAALGAAALLAWRERRAWTRPDRASSLVFAASLVVTAALVARTLVLAGVPTIGPDALMSVWTALGFELKDPVGTLDWTRPQDYGDLPQLTADLLLFPTRLDHIVITWIGNAWLWLAVYAVLAALVLRRRVALDARAIVLSAPVLAVGMLLALGVAYHYRGGDGNYLIAPLALGSIVTVACAAAVMRERPMLELSAFAGIVAACAFHALFSFANAAWSTPGTRSIDADFTRSPIDTRHLRRDELVAAGLAEFENWLRTAPRQLRVIGYAEREDQAYWLSARYESLGNLQFMRPELVYDAAGFARLLDLAAIDVVLLPKAFDPRRHARAVFDHAAVLAQRPGVVTRDFGAFLAYDLTGRRG